MFFQSPSKKDLRKIRALEQITALIGLRVCLASIRAGKIENAVQSMEHTLDCGISVLLSQIGDCDAFTKDCMEQEFRRLWLYRKDAPGYSTSYLDTLEPDLRDAMLRTRGEVEKILEQYKT